MPLQDRAPVAPSGCQTVREASAHRHLHHTANSPRAIVQDPAPRSLPRGAGHRPRLCFLSRHRGALPSGAGSLAPMEESRMPDDWGSRGSRSSPLPRAGHAHMAPEEAAPCPEAMSASAVQPPPRKEGGEPAVTGQRLGLSARCAALGLRWLVAFAGSSGSRSRIWVPAAPPRGQCPLGFCALCWAPACPASLVFWAPALT